MHWLAFSCEHWAVHKIFSNFWHAWKCMWEGLSVWHNNKSKSWQVASLIHLPISVFIDGATYIVWFPVLSLPHLQICVPSLLPPPLFILPLAFLYPLLLSLCKAGKEYSSAGIKEESTAKYCLVCLPCVCAYLIQSIRFSHFILFAFQVFILCNCCTVYPHLKLG